MMYESGPVSRTCHTIGMRMHDSVVARELDLSCSRRPCEAYTWSAAVTGLGICCDRLSP